MAENKYTIDADIKALTQIVLDAKIHYEIWWELSGPKRPNYVSILNDNLYFWRPTIKAHLLTLNILLYKLYDPRKDVLSLLKLQKRILHNELLNKEDIVILQKEIDKALIIWNKVKILRHKIFAHKSKKLNVSEIYKQAMICPDEFKELIFISENIINLISGNINSVSIFFTTNVTNDIYSILSKLKE